MKVMRTVAELRAWRRGAGSVGMVPTMGALHAGHRGLVERAVRENEAALVSIFVNPTQFSPAEDLAAYPRDEARDLAVLEETGAAAAFVPSVEEMYPPGDTTRVDPGPIAMRLEGAARPGHLTGVATVVTKLLAAATPDRAYFGQKDYQQLRVVQTLARDLLLGARIVPCETVREPDGLALSSRNAYLSPTERVNAAALSRALFRARDAFDRGGRSAAALRELVIGELRTLGITPEYVSVADPLALEELTGRAERAVVLLAARIGKARLIDNVLLGMSLEDLG